MTELYTPVDAPAWMLDAKTNKPATFLPKMDTDGGKLHFLCPPGIGDVAWIWAKFWKLAQERDITFWFQNDEIKRSGQYARLVGMKHDYCPIDIRELRQMPGEFTEEELRGPEGFVGYLHANLHIENGKPLKDWHPFLPLKNPAPRQFGRWFFEDKGGPLEGWSNVPIAVHMCSAIYQEGNWPAKQWAKMLEAIEKSYGPVQIVGAYWGCSATTSPSASRAWTARWRRR
jgi:hypothetical protein